MFNWGQPLFLWLSLLLLPLGGLGFWRLREHEKNLARWADHPALGKMRIKGNDRESRLRLAFQLLALLF
ncbi:MAG: hypothetical protein ACM3YO_03285, partial [Bacteroidota bacterium]